MSSTALTIQCAKDDCHWSGSPADAAGHACPTPATDEPAEPPAATESNVFAGVPDISGKPIADEQADRSLPYWIVWTEADETRILGTHDDYARAISAAAEIAGELTRGEVNVRHVPAGEGDGEPPVTQEIARDAEPETREELELWLLEHGDYSDDGIPQDEKTARLDARLSALQGERDDEPPNYPAEPDGVEPEPELEPEPVAETEAEGSNTEADDSILAIAAQVRAQEGIAGYRWILVRGAFDREPELIGRAKVKTEIEELRRNVVAESGLAEMELAILSTKKVLDEAARIEEARETAVQEPQEAAGEPAGAESGGTVAELAAKAQKAAEQSPEADRKGSLFDASAFDRLELQLPPEDGHTIDKIAIGFAGEILLDRSNPDHVALFRRLKLFRHVELWVSGEVKGKGTTGATNRDGELDVVVAKRSVRIEHVRVLGPEELEDAAREMSAQARDADEAEAAQEAPDGD